MTRQRGQVPSPSPPPPWVLQRRRQVGERIRAVRLAANLTQERLALAAEIDRPSVVRIEQGQQSPTLDTLIRLADAIGVPLRDLVG
ncbi:helix-turn-helix domain-containing protein [Streptomyces luteogriseus]|uniref:helix-turn-helix domain-containing protein n=1 Tax=Streptomyces luteogriseus TaxID=68233 RepID=UPI0036E2B4D6